jgi:hypothetical protein
VTAGIIQTVVGIVAIVCGCSQGEFYAAFIRRPKPDEKPAPKWLGRTIFVDVGVWFIISAILSLRR